MFNGSLEAVHISVRDAASLADQIEHIGVTILDYLLENVKVEVIRDESRLELLEAAIMQ